MMAFYFGCACGIDGRRDVGHYLYQPGRDGDLIKRGYKSRKALDELIPWGATPDATLAPRPSGRHSEAPQGVAALHHKDGWTALSFWDRSGDSRPNSNSTFMFYDHLTFEEIVKRAKVEFPALFERFPFEIVEWKQ